MPVKYWSFAGLLLTYRCPARCQSCYLCCSPGRREEMTVESAVTAWAGLAAASPRGCRVHLSGGEPFLNWELLIGICRAAMREGLAPLEKVETNAFWAESRDIVRDRLRQLDEAGMRKLSISADPYHQQFVPLDRAALAADVAREVLGGDRVQVRWEDWLRDGRDTAGMSEEARRRLFIEYASRGRDRFCGRAAERLAPHLELKAHSAFADKPCREAVLRCRHVHVDPRGRVMPGTCAGIVLGEIGLRTAGEIWRRLDADHASRPIVGRLATAGPAGLVEEARRGGMTLREGYAGKCHLCWEVRRFFALSGMHRDEIGPAWMYEEGQEA